MSFSPIGKLFVSPVSCIGFEQMIKTLIVGVASEIRRVEISQVYLICGRQKLEYVFVEALVGHSVVKYGGIIAWYQL